ncbi:MAG: PQQ-binding-like beta-propeller repeat protein [Lentisphaerae bacterium]|nr:PQQ-binding-like beta-propeller repeat protein [Lentisphaerota bacterium]MBT4820046.1 PQQ-binding-like beta-propeller repeat protein [Lentisphaerota bacterium]MBT5612781.1 PQQ-binding-like beta-propeller repeat protein [Lentisphaerota bacterium]MBT7059955.1 PQQ-binding-like beta-propeller repeat protein [Lentisphaerota bacterium]MBT7842145.1 PQQ-binding-like beta-propeller repeat protein [Lentisphaerota bacterium]
MTKTNVFSAVLVVTFLLSEGAMASDWPMWRHDPQRSGLSRQDLPPDLHLLWTRDLPKPNPAWSDVRLGFDLAPHPVVAGKTVLLGDSRTGSLLALDTETGGERWRFWADGPVRLAPAVSKGRVYVVSDDGFLYCLALADGDVLWTFFGGLKQDRLLANGQLSSMWPARGGPVVAEGRVYFAAGVWPFMGTPVYALDAESGRELWTNDRNGVLHTNRAYHQYKAYWGTSPQGSLALDEGTLVVPSCRSQPLFLNALSGEITRADAGWKDYGGGGDAQIALAGKLLLVGGYVFARDTMLPLCLNADAKGLKPFACLPVSDGESLYVATSERIEGHDLREATLKRYTGNYGVRLVRCDTKPLWQMPHEAKPVAMIKAGGRLYVAFPGKVVALSPSPGKASPEISWQAEMKGTPSELAAADGKLFATTREGRLWCFGAGPTEARDWPRRQDATGSAPQRQALAQRLLKLSGAKAGHCIVLGLTDGSLVTELLRQSDLQVVVIDDDPKAVQALRERLAAVGPLGERASVHLGDPADPRLPQYLASLLVSERPASHGMVKVAASVLRPYDGVACLPVPASGHGDLDKELSAYRGKFTTSFDSGLALIRRVGGPEGAADWGHETAGPGNTWMGRDRAVKAPLGVLWFGGPSESRQLYRSRHSDPATARVVDGRLFIYGNGTITAVDAYTGRVCWKRRMPKRKPFTNKRSYAAPGPFPGPIGDAPATAWYVACPDALYIAYGQACDVWDPVTGKTLRTFALDDENGAKRFWGDLRVWEDMLVAGMDFPTEDVESEFVAADLADAEAGRVARLNVALQAWVPPSETARSAGETDIAFAVRRLNVLLDEGSLGDSVPPALLDGARVGAKRSKAVQGAVAAIKRHRNRTTYAFTPYLSMQSLNRRLLEACYPELRRNPDKKYWHNLYPWDGTFTKTILGMDRQTGETRWEQTAQYGFPQKSLAVGNGKVFCIDRVEIDRDSFLARRGTPKESHPSIRAFDARSGRQLWTVGQDVDGYHLMYCPDQDILIQPSSHDPDPPSWNRKKRLQWVRLIAYRGSDGTVLWDSKLELERSTGRHRMWWNWFVHRDTIVIESYYDTHADFYGFDLQTGKQKVRKSALTGVEVPWGFRRRGGCTKNLCSENMVFFRSNTAGYYDAQNDAGTVNLGGFRNGCKNSLIPAAGILNAPNYASGCTCNYPVFTALALVHMPDVEAWSTSTYTWDGARVKRVGINLGAPGDHRATNGTLWLDYPSVGGDSPDIPVTVTPAEPRWLYGHSARMRGGALPRVAASGAEGLTTLTVTLAKDGDVQAASYTVRLCFAERDDLKPGERVFGVALQGKRVVEQLDVVKEAGLKTGLVKEFHGIDVPETLKIELIPAVGKPILCGVEVVLESTR